jgi:hypothetical protein
MSASRHPNQFLIIVNVTFTLGGPQYAYRFLADGTDASLIKVGPGDQVGWFVKVSAGSQWSQPAYTLTFANPSILGKGSISVPNGGPSGFFTVVAVTGNTKYSLAVSGIFPASDPQMQVDPNGVLVIETDRHFTIRWTAASNKVELDDGSGSWLPFPNPLTIAPGDAIQFDAVLNQPPPDFAINFPPDLNQNRAWASPFDLVKTSFFATAPGSNETTGDLTINDKSDPGKTFHFVAELTDESQKSKVCNLKFS